MKRKIFFLIIIACFTVVSLGQRRTRTAIQRIIQLTKPATSGGKSFQEALSNLRPSDRFTGMAIDKTAIGQLAWAGLGNRMNPVINPPVTPAPLESPFPTRIFIASNEGVFYYQPINHSLEQIVESDIRLSLANATSMPVSVSSSGCVMIITSSVTRNSSSPRSSTATSAKNAMLIEAGHIAQNIQLQAVCMEGLSSIAINAFEASSVSKICNIPRGNEVLYIVCVGYVAEQDGQGDGNTSATAKSAAIIVPSEKFGDEEFFNTYASLNAASVRTVVASNKLGFIKGMNPNSSPFEVQVLANQLRVDDFDGIIIIGGDGAGMFINDQFVINIVREAFVKNKIIGATSLGTAVLANAGILKSGIKVTGLPKESENIAKMGGIYTGELVTSDSNIITCAGPIGAAKFARDITNAILRR
jgi:protease I